MTQRRERWQRECTKRKKNRAWLGSRNHESAYYANRASGAAAVVNSRWLRSDAATSDHEDASGGNRSRPGGSREKAPHREAFPFLPRVTHYATSAFLRAVPRANLPVTATSDASRHRPSGFLRLISMLQDCPGAHVDTPLDSFLMLK